MASGTGWIRPPWYEKYSLLWFSEDLGVKREELTETLWNKYNEVPFPIQSLDAFHCDALAASRQAKDVDEFHTLMEATKKQRLQEFGYCAFDTRMILGRNSHSDQSLLGPTKTLVTTASLEAIIDTATSILGGVEAKKPLELDRSLDDESKQNLQYLRDHPEPPRETSPPRQYAPTPRGQDPERWERETPIRRTTGWLRDRRMRTASDFWSGPGISPPRQSKSTDTSDLAEWIHGLSRTTPDEEPSSKTKETSVAANEKETRPRNPKTVLGKRQTGKTKKAPTPKKVTKKTAETHPTPTRQTRSMTKRIASSPIPTPVKDTPKRSKPPSRTAAPKAAPRTTARKKR